MDHSRILYGAIAVSLAQCLTELDAVAFRCFDEELPQPPRLVGDRFRDKHLASNILLVQVINAHAIDVCEPRMISRGPRRHLTLSITDHKPKIPKLKERPAPDPVVFGKPELIGEVCDRNFEVIDCQYMLRFVNFEIHERTFVILPRRLSVSPLRLPVSAV